MPSFFADPTCRMQDAYRLLAATGAEHKRARVRPRGFDAYTEDVMAFLLWRT